MATAIKTWQIYVASIIIIILGYYAFNRDMEEEVASINWDIIQTIIEVVIAIVAGIWAYFSYKVNSDNKIRNQNLANYEKLREQKLADYENIQETRDKNIMDSMNEFGVAIKEIAATLEENREDDIRTQQKISVLEKGHDDHETRLRKIEREIK